MTYFRLGINYTTLSMRAPVWLERWPFHSYAPRSEPSPSPAALAAFHPTRGWFSRVCGNTIRQRQPRSSAKFVSSGHQVGHWAVLQLQEPSVHNHQKAAADCVLQNNMHFPSGMGATYWGSAVAAASFPPSPPTAIKSFLAAITVVVVAALSICQSVMETQAGRGLIRKRKRRTAATRGGTS